MDSNKKVYMNVSDLALCQKCPALFAYKIIKREKDAWRVGIHGTEFYGSLFHKNIARVFFDAAANNRNRLHEKISRSLKNPRALENVIRENIFMPFLEYNAQKFSDALITAMARAIGVWVKAMSEFFSLIPSLEKNMRFIFHEPEKKLQAAYNFTDGQLIIIGCYDALLFNPEKAEARLFEFKGYKKNDILVPLSQSLIYAWLINKHSGFVPSIEIIYLDELERTPDVFTPQAVAGMMGNLPGLFRTAFNIFSFRGVTNFLRDRNLCNVCKFKWSCFRDWPRKKRRGSSLLSVMIFMLLAVMIGAQVFFFSVMSANSTSGTDTTKQVRFSLDNLVNKAKVYIKNLSRDLPVREADYKTFHELTQIKSFDYGIFRAHINNLRYIFTQRDLPSSAGFNDVEWDSIPLHERVFSPVSNDDMGHYFLIRAYEKDNFMYQILILKTSRDKEIYTLSHNEIWY